MGNSPEFSDAEIRSILLELRRSTLAKIRAKYGLTAYRLQKIRKAAPPVYRTMQDTVLTALYMKAHTMDRIVSTVDYLNHGGYPEPQLLAALETLVAQRLAVREGDKWRPTLSEDEKFCYLPPAQP